MNYPRASTHYPKSVGEFQAWFRTDADCLDYLQWLRWPAGFVCPDCGCTKSWRLRDGRFMCSECGGRASVTAGTIFDRTRTPLTVWFTACWRFATGKDGISALSLKRVLEIGSYQTAWAMLRRLRSVSIGVSIGARPWNVQFRDLGLQIPRPRGPDPEAPRISEETVAGRLRKYHETIVRRQGEDCLANLPNNLEDQDGTVSARLTVARMMKVSDRYVGYALRLQREAPELFHRVWSGQMTMPAALRELRGEAVPELTQAVEACRRRLNKALRNRQRAPALLARLTTVLDQFEREAAEGEDKG